MNPAHPSITSLRCVHQFVHLLTKFGVDSPNCMPPADTAALICLGCTNACVVSIIIIFRCGRMAPPQSKRLGSKHVIVHFRQRVYTMIQVIQVHNTYECGCEYVLTKHYRTCRHTVIVGGNCMGNNLYLRKEEESKRMSYLGEEKKS